MLSIFEDSVYNEEFNAAVNGIASLRFIERNHIDARTTLAGQRLLDSVVRARREEHPERKALVGNA